ncbi:MAG: YidC/Oxa1 family membrane protein insertase [Oscillospiraceae bacterium]|nr:YidC/Oxa1 family membrane protein insertase [Oscillospiraceae bacterium]
MGKLISIPFAAVLRWLYAVTGSYGLAIILFSLVVKLVLLPFQMKSKRSMVRMGRLTGRQEELQKQYAKNPQKYQEELQKLYMEEGINPMGGCLWSFLPLFILVPLYSVIRMPITYFMGLSDTACEALRNTAAALGYVPDEVRAGAYSAYEQIYLSNFISQNWSKTDWSAVEGVGDRLIQVRYSFLGVDLSVQPQTAISNFSFTPALVGLILIPVLAAGLQYFQTIIMSKSNGQSAQQQASMKMLNLTMPLMTLWFCFIMPAALGLYWIANSVFAMIQEPIMGKFYTDKLNAEEEERAAKREAERKLRMEEAKLKAAEQRVLDAKRPKKQPQKSSGPSTTEAGRVGDRPYARGRSYRADRYDGKE